MSSAAAWRCAEKMRLGFAAKVGRIFHDRPQGRSGLHLFSDQLPLVDGPAAEPERGAVGRRRDRRGQPRRPRAQGQGRRRQGLVRGMGAHGRQDRGARPRRGEEGPQAHRRRLPDARRALLPDRRALPAARSARARGLQEGGEVVRRRRGDDRSGRASSRSRCLTATNRCRRCSSTPRRRSAGNKPGAGAGVLRRLRHHQGDPIFQGRARSGGARHRLPDRRRAGQRRERALPRPAADRGDREIRHRGLRISRRRARRSIPSASA